MKNKSDANIVAVGFFFTMIPTLVLAISTIINPSININLSFWLGCIVYIFGVVIMALPAFRGGEVA